MLKVLIADDEVKVNQLIFHLVQWQDFGMEVIGTVNDGIAAYETILKERPDIVITDIRMPGIDGIELAEKVTREMENIFFIIISGYSQFEYAQQAVKLGVEDYLLKPIKRKELEAVLNKILQKHNEKINHQEERRNLLDHLEVTREKVKNNFLSELIDNHRQAILKMNQDELYREFECRFTSRYFTHIVVHLFTDTIMENDEEYGFLLPKIQKVMKEKLEKYCAEMMGIIHEEEIICLLNTQENTREELIRQLYKAKVDLSNIKALFPRFRVVIGIGKTVDELGRYMESVSSANGAVRNRFGRDDQFIIEDASSGEEHQIMDFLTTSDKKELLTAMELLDVENFKKNMTRTKQKLSPYIGDGQLVYGIYRELVETILFGIKNYFPMEKTITAGKLMKGYMHLYGFEEVFDWLIRECGAILSQYEEAARNQEAKPIRMAKQYINENYNKAINLESVSRHTGFNPAYFSSMFKKATGQNFMDYVIEVRIDKAKYLLIHSNYDVADVAAEVGYTDLKYFSKIFKKLTNLTPSEYRKLYG